MAVNDFTGKNIQDTYQKVVQTDGTNLADGTGSLLPISFEGNDVIIPGALKAQSYIVSESIINVSSGSTVFGDSIDDSHNFKGAITASGDISSSGDIKGYRFINGEQVLVLPNGTLSATFSNNNIATTNIKAGTSINLGNDTIVDGNISASLVHTHVIKGQTTEPTGLNVSGYVLATNITASGNISSSGQISALAYNIVDTQILTQLTDVGGTTTLNIGNTNNSTEIKGTNIKLDAPVTASGNISASGDLIVNNINGTINGGTF